MVNGNDGPVGLFFFSLRCEKETEPPGPPFNRCRFASSMVIFASVFSPHIRYNKHAMKLQTFADRLWGERGRLAYLLVASAVLLFAALGARDIWTQEHRWADIVSGMFYRHDFLHPYLGENRYYDKPLLSYWLIAAIAQLTGGLTTWALRLPSALSGLLAIWSIYRLGNRIKDKQLGLLAGWMLLTTFYFLFWARTSSADMLNLAGSLFAVSWYMDRRDTAGFFDYMVFFLVIALTSLCKGLGGAAVPVIAVFADVMLRGTFKQYLKLSVFVSALPALLIYVAPFIASSMVGGDSYGQNGLYMVYRENVLRYFQPFDHQGPLYTYFIYLPVYMMPWALFFIPALVTVKSRWRAMSLDAKWCALSLLLLFVFFTASGSRRSYYVLPMVPFAILFTAEWLQSKRAWAAGLVAIALPLLCVVFNFLPVVYYAKKSVNHFAQTLQHEASTIKPWSSWNVVMLDGESKLNFYLGLPPTTKHYHIIGDRFQQTSMSLLVAWPILMNKPANTIFITRKIYAAQLQPYFNGYRIVEAPHTTTKEVDTPIAFVPASA